MIGNPNWFKRRKYTGWGVTPATWQGWAYIGSLLAIFIASSLALKLIGASAQVIIVVMTVLFVIFAVDLFNIMRGLGKDERETSHEALAERNAAWIMVAVLGIGLVYQLCFGSGIDPFLVIALIGGTVAKAVTNWYLSDR